MTNLMQITDIELERYKKELHHALQENNRLRNDKLQLAERITKLEAEKERLKNLLIRTKNILASDGLDKKFIPLYYEIEEALEEQ